MQIKSCAGAFLLWQKSMVVNPFIRYPCLSSSSSENDSSNNGVPVRRKRRRRRSRPRNIEDQNPFRSASIDSFLAGDYAHPFAPEAPAPNPLLSPGKTVDVSLRALRQLDEPFPCHGAAVFMRFCIPLTRGEQLGGNENNPWKNILRCSLTSAMLAQNIRASPQFACLLDWDGLDVTEGVSNLNPSGYSLSGFHSITYVNAGLFFEHGPPKIVHFVLKNVGTTWFIDSINFGTESESTSEHWSLDVDDDELFLL